MPSARPRRQAATPNRLARELRSAGAATSGCSARHRPSAAAQASRDRRQTGSGQTQVHRGPVPDLARRVMLRAVETVPRPRWPRQHTSGRRGGQARTVADYAKIFKAYDIRGLVPDELDEGVAEAVGTAFATLTGARAVVTVRDMRTSSRPLAAAFARGVTAAGSDVVDGGLGSTDMLYYASGCLDLPGAMLTASHNPAKYNGIKLCRAGAKPIGQDTGLAELRDLASAGTQAAAATPGAVRSQDLLSGYVDYLRKLVDLASIRP